MSWKAWFGPALALLSISGVAVAQQNTGSFGAPSTLSPRIEKLLSDFKASPELILEQNPNGGGALAAAIRDIMVADKGQLDAILQLVSKATAAQQEAIGSGLGLARLLYVRDPDTSNLIQSRVVELANRNLLAGFVVFGGGGVAAIGTGGVIPGAPVTTSGPVGNIGDSPGGSGSQGRGGGGGGGESGGGGSGLSARNAASGSSVSP